LKGGETEEVNKSITKLKVELPEDYFAECTKGYIVNFYNVKKIDRVNHNLVMYSGYKIPISPRRYTDIVRKFMEVMFGM
jgi:DNA-binding LytR/AlgR family response regulator